MSFVDDYNTQYGAGNFTPSSGGSVGIKQNFLHPEQNAKQPPQAHYAKGIGGFLERSLPTIGGLVGGGVGLLTGGIAAPFLGGGGAIAGQKLEDVLTGQHTSGGEYALQGALGGLTGIGKGLAAAKAGVDVARGGGAASEVANALRGGTGEVAGNLASAGGKTITGAAGNKATTFGNKILQSGAQLTNSRANQQLLDNLPNVTAKMADYGAPRASQWETIANKVTGTNGVLNQTKNNIISRAEAKGATVNTEGFGSNQFSPARPGMGTRVRDVFDLNKEQPVFRNGELQNSDVHNAIIDNVSDPAKQNQAHLQAKNVSNAVAKAGNTPTSVFQGVKKLDSLAAKAYAAKNEDLAGAYREMSQSLKGRLDESISGETVTKGDINNMVNGLRGSGVTNPNLVKDVKALEGGSALGIRSLEKTFVDASHIGASTRRATAVEEGGLVNRGGMFGLGGLANAAVERPVMGVGRQVLGRGARGVGAILGKGATSATGEAPGIGQALKGAAKTQLPARLFTGQLTTPTEQPQQPVSQSAQPGNVSDLQDLINQSTTGATSQSLPQDNSPFSAQNIQNAIMQDIATTGGKNIDKLNALYNTFGSPKAQTADLTTNQQKAITGVQGATAALSDYANQIDSLTQGASGNVARGTISRLLGQYYPGASEADKNAAALASSNSDTAVQIASALSGGGKAPVQLIRQIRESLPSINDSPGLRQAKVQQLVARLQDYAQAESTPLSQLVGAQ